MRLRAGELRHPIEIQENVGTSQDTTGQVIPKWETRVCAMAKLKWLNGAEVAVFDQQQDTKTCLISTHYFCSATPKPTWRIVNRGRVFEIASVTNVDEANETYEFVCTTTDG